METVRTTDHQFRRPLRHCGCVRARESAQSSNQHRLGAVEGHRAARRLCAVFHTTTAGNVEQDTVSKFNGTTNESAIQKDSITKSERAHYFDAGMTQQISKGFN